MHMAFVSASASAALGVAAAVRPADPEVRMRSHQGASTLTAAPNVAQAP